MKKRKIVFLFAIFSLAAFLLANIHQESEKSKDHHKIPSPERISSFEKQEVTVNDFDAQGYILAIGGGGEGVIGQLKGQQVISIDISKRELEETPEGPLKVIMDARDLKFLDNTFNTAASFFTLCYIDESDHEKVFKEIFRVIASGGRFLIWDVIFPKRVDEKKDIAIVPLLVKLPNKEISTGYGVHWPEKAHDLSYYMQLAEKIGFKLASQKEKDRWFFLELIKP
jgi:SAM-dependent methyltransferase